MDKENLGTTLKTVTIIVGITLFAVTGIIMVLWGVGSTILHMGSGWVSVILLILILNKLSDLHSELLERRPNYARSMDTRTKEEVLSHNESTKSKRQELEQRRYGSRDSFRYHEEVDWRVR